MPAADLVRLGLAPGLTNQDLASLALNALQSARLAKRAGRQAEAEALEAEALALADLVQ